MTYKETKEQSESMLFDLLLFIKAAELTEREEYELKTELACSICTACFDFDDKHLDENIKKFNSVLKDIHDIGIGGMWRACITGDYKPIC